MEFKELKEKVIENIEKLIEIDKSEFEGRSREKLINFRNELERELTFKVLCLGDFNSGKTTFVNRFFLEEDLLPTGIIPTTAKLTVIKYSNEKKVEINSGDESVIISDNIAEKLKDILTKKSDSKTVVIVNYPSNMLKEGIEVIDSPGLNDPDEERMDVTYKIIDSVDCILYFLTAHQVWKRSEKEFLEKRVLSKHHLDKVIFVMTYWDVIDEKERDDVLSYVTECMRESLKVTEERLSELTGKEVKLPLPRLVPVSAKTGENFKELKKELWEYFSNIDKAKILQSKIRIFNSFIDDCISLLKEREKGLSKKQEELEKRLSELQREVEKYKDEVEDLKDRIESRIRLAYRHFISDLEAIEYEVLKSLEKELKSNLERYEHNPENLSKEKVKAIVRNAISVSSITAKSKFVDVQRDFLSEIFEILREEKSRLKLNKSLLERNLPLMKEVELENFELQKTELMSNIAKAVGVTSAIGTVVDAVGYAVVSGQLAAQGFLSSIGSWLFSSQLVAIQSLTFYLLPVGIAATVGAFMFSRWLKNKQHEKFKKMVSDMSEEVKGKLRARIDEWLVSLKEQEDTIVDAIIKGIHNSVIEAYNNKLRELRKIIELKEKGVSTEGIEQLRRKLELLKL